MVRRDALRLSPAAAPVRKHAPIPGLRVSDCSDILRDFIIAAPLKKVMWKVFVAVCSLSRMYTSPVGRIVSDAEGRGFPSPYKTK